MPFLLAKILNFQGTVHLIGVGSLSNIFFLIFAIVASTPLLKKIHKKVVDWHRKNKKMPYVVYAYEIVSPIVLLILSTMALVGNSYNPFLYFQF